MGQVYQEFERVLASWREKYSSRPPRELMRLLLLALECEEIVSIGYREEVILHRLARIPVDPEVRELIRHSMLWAWKDEEMHAIYVRGTILKLRHPALHGTALAAADVRGDPEGVILRARRRSLQLLLGIRHSR